MAITAGIGSQAEAKSGRYVFQARYQDHDG